MQVCVKGRCASVCEGRVHVCEGKVCTCVKDVHMCEGMVMYVKERCAHV